MSSETVGIKHSDLVEVSWKVVGFEHEAESLKIASVLSVGGLLLLSSF